jgi:hypothetical protein
MKTNGKLTISKAEYSHGKPTIQITIHDPDAVTGVTAEVSLEDYAQAISGLARVDCNILANHPERLGLQRESMPLEFPCSDRDAASDSAWLACPEGWEPDLYFGSQSSFFRRDGEQWARTTAYRWVGKDA